MHYYSHLNHHHHHYYPHQADTCRERQQERHHCSLYIPYTQSNNIDPRGIPQPFHRIQLALRWALHHLVVYNRYCHKPHHILDRHKKKWALGIHIGRCQLILWCCFSFLPHLFKRHKIIINHQHTLSWWEDCCKDNAQENNCKKCAQCNNCNCNAGCGRLGALSGVESNGICRWATALYN